MACCIRWAYGFLCLLVSGLPFSSLASESFVVGVEAVNYEPYFNNKANGEYYGAARDLLDLFAETQGYTFEYKVLPVKRLFSDFIRSQTLDFKFPDNPKWRPELKTSISITYSDLVFIDKSAIMVLPTHKAMQPSELKKLGTILGFTPWPFMEKINQGQIRLAENRSFTGLIKQTLTGRVDGAFINTVVARYALKHTFNQPKALVIADNLPLAIGEFYLSSIQHPQIIAEFNQFLSEQAAAVDAIKTDFEIVP